MGDRHPELPNKLPVVIHNHCGKKLVGILHETGSKELVIVCHGFQSSKDRIPMVNLAAAFEREGISAFRFDFAGNGGSEGSFQYGNYRREAEDLRSVVQHFRRKERVIKAIIGHSKGFSSGSSWLYVPSHVTNQFSKLKQILDYFIHPSKSRHCWKFPAGGNVVLLYASKYKDVSMAINISGRFNLERGIEGRLGPDYLGRIKQYGFIDVKNKKGKFEYRVTEESLMDRLTTDTRAACLMICQDCKVLTVHGSMDRTVPATDASEFDKFIPNHKVHIIEGADHEFTLHQDELASVVLDFVRPNDCNNRVTPKLPLHINSRI